MKVLYELDLNDIIRIVSEKYGVPQEKVKKTNKDGLNYLMIDMSTTETPGETVPENKEPTTEEQKAILKSLKKEQTKTKMPGIDGDITIYTCPVCGKEFDTEKYPQYAYKKRAFNHNHVFCGYDCMRKAEKALNP